MVVTLFYATNRYITLHYYTVHTAYEVHLICIELDCGLIQKRLTWFSTICSVELLSWSPKSFTCCARYLEECAMDDASILDLQL